MSAENPTPNQSEQRDRSVWEDTVGSSYVDPEDRERLEHPRSSGASVPSEDIETGPAQVPPWFSEMTRLHKEAAKLRARGRHEEADAAIAEANALAEANAPATPLDDVSV